MPCRLLAYSAPSLSLNFKPSGLKLELGVFNDRKSVTVLVFRLTITAFCPTAVVLSGPISAGLWVISVAVPTSAINALPVLLLPPKLLLLLLLLLEIVTCVEPIPTGGSNVMVSLLEYGLASQTVGVLYLIIE